MHNRLVLFLAALAGFLAGRILSIPVSHAQQPPLSIAFEGNTLPLGMPKAQVVALFPSTKFDLGENGETLSIFTKPEKRLVGFISFANGNFAFATKHWSDVVTTPQELFDAFFNMVTNHVGKDQKPAGIFIQSVATPSLRADSVIINLSGRHLRVTRGVGSTLTTYTVTETLGL